MSELISKGYYEEKKSRFYCFLYKLENVEEVKPLVEKAKEIEKSIKHAVVVYRFVDSEGNNKLYATNDREPIKSAEQIMFTLEKQNVTNMLVIIVRHYGGTPLGANNLSKAYIKAFKSAFENR